MISDETIAAVRERVDIVALISQNVRLKRQGRRFLGLCPFHKEKTPSFSVNQERGFFHCFGCKASGSAIDYVMQLEGYSFPDAVRELAESCGVEVDEVGSQVDREQMDRRKREREELYSVMRVAAAYFEQQLDPRSGHPLAVIAREELTRRGLPFGSSDEQIAEALSSFHIGYAPFGWDGLSKYLARQELSPQIAHRVGLVAPRRGGEGYYDFFRHRLMFAVVDNKGRVVAFSGRALPEPSDDQLQQAGQRPMGRRDDPPPKYINSSESPIYQKGEILFGLFQARSRIRQEGQAVLVEGNFDVLALHARGLDNVVGPLGTAFTLEQAKLLKRYAPTLIALLDGDTAGRKATEKLRGPGREAGLAVKVASLPAGVDPDDHAREHGIEAVQKIVANGQDMLEYLIEQALGGEAARGASLRDRQQRIQQVMGYLRDEADPTVRTMAKAYADRLSAQLVVAGHAPSDIRSLEAMVKRALAHGDRPEQAPERPWDGQPVGPRARSRPREEDIGMAVVGALLDYPELLDDPLVDGMLAQAEGAIALAVLAVRQIWGRKKTLEGRELLDLMPRAVHSFASDRLVAPKFESLEDARMELLENGKKLQWLSFKGDTAATLDELAQAERLGDTAQEDELLRQLSRRTRKKHGLS